MNDGLKDFLSNVGFGALWAVGIVVLLALGVWALFGPFILAQSLHNPSFFWLYFTSPPLIGAFIGGAIWFEDNT